MLLICPLQTALEAIPWGTRPVVTQLAIFFTYAKQPNESWLEDFEVKRRSVKSSELSSNVFSLLFTDQIFKNSECIPWSKDSVEYLFQNTQSSLSKTGPRF